MPSHSLWSMEIFLNFEMTHKIHGRFVLLFALKHLNVVMNPKHRQTDGDEIYSWFHTEENEIKQS